MLRNLDGVAFIFCAALPSVASGILIVRVFVACGRRPPVGRAALICEEQVFVDELIRWTCIFRGYLYEVISCCVWNLNASLRPWLEEVAWKYPWAEANSISS